MMNLKVIVLISCLYTVCNVFYSKQDITGEILPPPSDDPFALAMSKVVYSALAVTPTPSSPP